AAQHAKKRLKRSSTAQPRPQLQAMLRRSQAATLAEREGDMATLEVKSLETPEEVRGRTRLVTLPAARAGLAVSGPRWRRSVPSKPVFGGESCRTAHLGYLISGCPPVQMDEGGEAEIRAGSAFQIAPGHDAWVVGDEPCTFAEFFPKP